MAKKYQGQIPENTPEDPERDYRTGLGTVTEGLYSWAARHEIMALMGGLAGTIGTTSLLGVWLVAGTSDPKLGTVVAVATLGLGFYGFCKLTSRFQIAASQAAFRKTDSEDHYYNHVLTHEAGHLDRKGMRMLDEKGTGSETRGQARRLFEKATEIRSQRDSRAPNIIRDDPVYPKLALSA